MTSSKRVTSPGYSPLERNMPLALGIVGDADVRSAQTSCAMAELLCRRAVAQRIRQAADVVDGMVSSPWLSTYSKF